MSGELQRYTNGIERPNRFNRALARDAKKVQDDVQLSAFKANGAMALAGHIMEGVIGLNARRQALSQGDPATEAMLMDIQAQALLQVKNIQANLYNEWDL